LKEIYDIGIVFRGFVLVNYPFKELPKQKEMDVQKDLRGAFISAISSFAETAFENNNLEYLESGNILFIFKFAEIKSSDNNIEEPIILYCMMEKRKKNPDKDVKKILQKAELILQSFILKFNNYDFTEINHFQNFKDELNKFFIKKHEFMFESKPF
jgi:hypothetical protein